ncbi:MAG: hypothetical protein R3E87_22280 [Burkholderiaceae bacterium]
MISAERGNAPAGERSLAAMNGRSDSPGRIDAAPDCDAAETTCDRATPGCDTAGPGCDVMMPGCGEASAGCDVMMPGCGEATAGCDVVMPGCGEATAGCDVVMPGCGAATAGCDVVMPDCDEATAGCDVTAPAATASGLLTATCGTDTSDSARALEAGMSGRWVMGALSAIGFQRGRISHHESARVISRLVRV